MPFINVKTNIPVSENAQEALKTRLGQAIEQAQKQKERAQQQLAAAKARLKKLCGHAARSPGCRSATKS